MLLAEIYEAGYFIASDILSGECSHLALCDWHTWIDLDLSIWCNKEERVFKPFDISDRRVGLDYIWPADTTGGSTVTRHFGLWIIFTFNSRSKYFATSNYFLLPPSLARLGSEIWPEILCFQYASELGKNWAGLAGECQVSFYKDRPQDIRLTPSQALLSTQYHVLTSHGMWLDPFRSVLSFILRLFFGINLASWNNREGRCC